MGVSDIDIEGLTDFVEIGSGGFATVYAATDQRFGRVVAVKVLGNQDSAGRRRFKREQLSMGRMTGHPHAIIPYSSGFTSAGRPYLVMEFLSGGSLADLIASEGSLGWDRAVSALLPIADALGHGHRQGVLHRDVKPANILLDANGNTKLADFGIALSREGTATEVTPFTLAHSPPETFGGGVDHRDERSDLYSLASTLFQTVTGRAPYHSDEPQDSQPAYLMRIIRHPIPTIGGDPRRDLFLKSALAKDPDERPQTAADFISALTATVTAQPRAGSDDRPRSGYDPQAETRIADDAAWPAPPVPLAPRPGWYQTVLLTGERCERFWDGVRWRAATRHVEPDHIWDIGEIEPAEPLGTPPGWYDDPAGNQALERRWDGLRWSEVTRPIDRYADGNRL